MDIVMDGEQKGEQQDAIGDQVKGKRKVHFKEDDPSSSKKPHSEEVDDQDENDLEGEDKIPFDKKFKHTLDSDEEDDEERDQKYNVQSEDIEGEEDGDIRQEEEIQITPFNMKEEMEDGHVDRDGMYQFKKEDEDVKDSWLDNIDWVKIQERKTKESEEQGSSTIQDSILDGDISDWYKRMIAILLPEETVNKAMKRIGLKIKKDKLAEDKTTLNNLISLADRILQSGDMDIYQRTYEQLTFRLKQDEEKKAAESTATVSDAFDMFGDEVTIEASTSKTSTENQDVFGADTVQWELKWEDKEDAQVHGPFSNQQMVQWSEAGYFTNGALAREMNKPNSKFYSTKRIDFELYA